jgi:hypothetical protein
MNTINHLRFAVNDRINDMDVSPSHVSLALLGEFQKDVSEFLKGSSNEVNPNNVLVSIEPGSLSLVASGLVIASTLWIDLEYLKSTNSLSSIDSKRAKVIERWQAKAQKNPNRRYSVVNQSAEISFRVDSSSDFRKTEDMWVHVEKYLHGKIVDIGGKNKANVHLELEDGKSLLIAASQDLLEQEKQNRLYRPALLHVTAEENLITGELRNYQLLNFPDYHPSYNDDEFNLMVDRGTKVWADVPDATAWLENLRGNHL